MVKSLRESTIKDVLDIIDDAKDVINRGLGPTGGANSMRVSSISRASKDLIMSFPVLCDNSIDPKTASMICKAVERKAVAMLQMLFSSCAFRAENGREVIQQWHNNLGGGDMGFDDYLQLCDDLSARFENADMSPVNKRAFNEAVNQIKAELRAGDKSYPPSSISEHSVNDYRVNARFGRVVVTEAPTSIDDKNKDLMKNIDLGTQFFTKQLLDNDVKKCNELVPSLMIIRFVAPGASANDAGIVCQFVAGVKARLIPMDSYDIIDRINSKNKDRAGLLNFIRATTKEISFVKDYLFAIDKAKIDAQKNSVKNRSARIWKTLEKRATKSVWKRLIGRTNDAACITTLVISQQVANALKKEYGVNMADVKTASAIMDAYNLLAVVIVDESTEVARFLYDGDEWFEDLSFNTLERESGDGSYKKVINLLSKMNRG